MEKHQNYKKGEIIFKAGEVQDWLYYISWGQVGIYTNYETEPKRIAVMGPESFVGEMGVIDHSPRSATAVAENDCQLLLVTEDDFMHDPHKFNMLLQNTSRRIRELSKDYVTACQAIGEYVKAEEAGEAQSPELLAKMRKIAQNVRK